MGASMWSYVVPYRADLGAALRDLQLQVLRDEQYDWFDEIHRTDPDPPWPTTVEEIQQSPRFWTCGTHSILDITHLVDPSDMDEDTMGGMRPLRPEEATARFGSAHPTLADFEDGDPTFSKPSWGGQCVVLFAGGRPDAIAFYGFSGD